MPNGSLEETNQQKLLRISGEHMSRLLEAEGRRGRAGERINRVLFKDVFGDEPAIEGEEFSPQDQESYAVLQAYFGLALMVTCVEQCQYYFRRYPFRGLPISRTDHLRNCCEMYFDRIVQFRDRLKKVLNFCRSEGAIDASEVRRVLKIFDEAFDWEHRQRNQTHHHDRFDYLELNQLSLAEMVGTKLPETVQWMIKPRRLYRQAANEWVARIRTRVEGLNKVAEYAAELVLRCPSVTRLEAGEQGNR